MLLILSLQYVSCNFYYEGLDGEGWVLLREEFVNLFFLKPKTGIPVRFMVYL